MDGKEWGVTTNSSLWILSAECTLNGMVEDFTSTFFIPILTNITESVDNDSSLITLTFTGTYLMPCDLKYGISLDGTTHIRPLTSSPSDNTSIALLSSDESISYSNASSITAWLVYADTQSTDSLTLRSPSRGPSRGGGGSTSSKKSLFVLIFTPTFSFLFLLLLLLFLLFCYCRHRKKKEQKQQEGEEVAQAEKEEAPEGLLIKED